MSDSDFEHCLPSRESRVATRVRRQSLCCVVVLLRAHWQGRGGDGHEGPVSGKRLVCYGGAAAGRRPQCSVGVGVGQKAAKTIALCTPKHYDWQVGSVWALSICASFDLRVEASVHAG